MGSPPMEAFKTIAELARCALLVCSEDGKVRYANPAFASLFGYESADALIGSRVQDLCAATLLPLFHPPTSTPFRFSGKRRDGSLTEVALTAHAPLQFENSPASFFEFHDMAAFQQLEREVIRSSNSVREKIGRDLHDTVCQQISGIRFKARALQMTLEETAPEEVPAINEILEHLNEVQTHARTLSHGLAPNSEPQTLGMLLKKLAASTNQLFRIPCTCLVNDDPSLNQEALINLLRIAQEAVSNAIRHSMATAVTIALKEENSVLTMSVEDDGTGYPGFKAGSGIGLRTMEYRARDLGAQFDILAGSSGGTLVRCRLPILLPQPSPALEI